MNRILDFTPSPEGAVVSRILVQVHKAVDEHFPEAAQANRRFTKTVFSETDSEPTAASRPAAFADQEDTAPDRQPLPSPEEEAALRAQQAAEEHVLPPPPKPREAPRAELPKAQAPEPSAPPSYMPRLDPMRSHLGSDKSTELPPSQDLGARAQGPDWITRIAFAVLLAGLVMLAYVLFG